MLFTDQVKPGSRWGLPISFAGHLLAFTFLLAVPALRLPRPSETPSEFRQKFEGHEDKIVYYRFRKELPAVSPAAPRPREERPLIAEHKAAQEIVSAPPKAPKALLMVYTPAPRIAPTPAEAPNLIAIRLPPKGFAAPAANPAAPAERKIDVADAPQLAGALAPSVELSAPRLPPKAFTAPSLKPGEPAEQAITAAEAPQLRAAGRIGAIGLNAPALPGKGIEVAAAAPEVGANLAIVGLNPIDKLSALPTASSPGAFSAGPVVRKEGSTSDGSGRGIPAPDLFVRGTPAKKPDLYAMAHAAPTSETTLRAALGKGEPVAAPPSEPPPAGATRVSSAPDPRFNGREVFMMAIQMPQITSYSGSWLMWYAAHTAQEAAMAPIAPPIAHRKVDPKYIASAVSDRIEGRVMLGCVIDTDGRVSGVELLRGIDERLNTSAKDALSKWEFFPATRNGAPVAVDVVVEIPFRLEPVIKPR